MSAFRHFGYHGALDCGGQNELAHLLDRHRQPLSGGPGQAPDVARDDGVLTLGWPRQLQEQDGPADITLLLEGTFPMVRSDTSCWIEQLIRGLPELDFAIVFLGSRADQYQGILFDHPDNVVHLECHYLMQAYTQFAAPAAFEGNREAFAASDAMHQYFKTPDDRDPSRQLCDIARMLGVPGHLSHEDFLYSRQAWQQIVDYYRNYCSEPSFPDYFRSVRDMHSPLFLLAQIARRLPATRCLHAFSTGYTGFLGAIARHIHDVPYIVTEQGIDTDQRCIGPADAGRVRGTGQTPSDGYAERLWDRFFSGLGRLAYAAADPITSTCEGDRQRQILGGAREDYTRVIPNGVRLERFRPLRRITGTNTRPIIAFIGRGAPIEQIDAFIHAMRAVCIRMPEAEGWIVDPEAKSPEYTRQCQNLSTQQGLSTRIKLIAHRPTEDVLAQARLAVLAATGQAEHLVALEAMAAGVPMVCSDVGACYELVYGHAPAAASTTAVERDEAAGRIVPIADAAATAAAILELLDDDRAWHMARDVGMRRVDAQYAEQLMLERYRYIYNEATGTPHTAARLTD